LAGEEPREEAASPQTGGEEESPLLLIPEIKSKYEQFLKWRKEDLALELAYLKAALERVDDMTRYLIENMFMPFRIVLRNYTNQDGLLMGVRFEPAQIELLQDVTFKEYAERQIVHERRVARFDKSSMFAFMVIRERETRPFEEEY